METNKRIRNNSIDMIRGIVILVVVLGHSIQVSIINDEKSILWLLIKSFQMPLLFLISGFTAGYSYPKKDKDHFNFIIKKIKRLLIPYVVWMYIHYIIVCITPGTYKIFSIKSSLLELFISDFWFLRYLFVFFLIMWSCNEIVNYITKMKFSTIILVATTSIVAIIDRIPIMTESVSLMHWFYFVLGWGMFQLVEYSGIKNLFLNNDYSYWHNMLAMLVTVGGY